MIVKMNMGLKRLIVTVLAISLLISGLSLNALASEGESGEKIVIVNEDGSIEYETIYPRSEGIQLNFDSINDSSQSSNFQDDNQISTYASSGYVNISEDASQYAPYRYACYITSTFPNGEKIASSGIRVGRNVILVSAHSVWNDEKGGGSTSTLIGVGTYFMGDGSLKCRDGSIPRQRLILHEDWTKNQMATADWALLVISDEYVTENFNLFQKYGYVNEFSKGIGRKVTLIGYPGGDKFCYSKGEIDGTTDYKWNDKYKGLWTATSKSDLGLSGGAVIDDETGVLIGIVKGKDSGLFGKNAIVPLTSKITDVILQYAH